MLDFQPMQAQFRLGLDEGSDPNTAPPGRLVTAENVEWTKTGRAQKRSGCAALTSSVYVGGSFGVLSTAKRLFTRGSELCLIDGASVMALPSATATAWRFAGSVPNVGVETSTLIDTIAGAGAADLAVSSTGVQVHAWVTGSPLDLTGASPVGSLFVQVIDGDTSLVAPTLLNAQSCRGVRVLIIGTTAWVVTNDGGTTIIAYPINLSTGAVSAGTTLRADSAKNGWDALVIGSTIVIAYTATGPAPKLYAYDTSLVQVATSAITGEALAMETVSICGASGGYLAIAYAVINAGVWTLKAALADPSTLAQTVAPFTLSTSGSATVQFLGACVYDASNFVIVNHLETTYGAITYSRQIAKTGAVVANTIRGTYGKFPICRPFMLGGRCYVGLVDVPHTSGGALGVAETALVEIEVSNNGGAPGPYPHKPVAKLERLLGGWAAATVPLPSVTVSDNKAWMPVPFQGDPTSNWAYMRNGTRLAKLTVGASLPADMWRTVSVGQEAYTAAGLLAAYDGRTVFDYGFERAVWLPSATTATTGGNIAAGKYLYAGHGEYRSAAGVKHRGAVGYSDAITTTGTTSANTVRFAGLNCSLKQSLTIGYGASAPTWSVVAGHRTVANGTVYYRISTEPAANIIFVDQTAETQTLNDTSNDNNVDTYGTDLNVRPTLYTTGGILDDEQPPALLTLLLHKSRLWGIASDKRTIWYSKSFQDDLGTAPGFSVDFRIGFEDELTALASMDEKLIVFAGHDVWYILGDGPAPNGQNSDLTSPNAIQTDVGCTNPRSVVSMPDGVMFQSARGIYLLTRGLELVWVGRPVKDQLAAFPNVTSAVLVPKKNQVRFTCNNDAGTAHTVLVFDYVEKQWSTFRYLGGTVAIADACMWNGVYTFATTGGAIYREDASTYLDAGSWVTMTLETAWISASGPLGFQSVRRFALHGVSNSDHDLTVYVGYDRATAYDPAITWTAGSSVTSIGPLEAAEVHVGKSRKCSSIRFKIVDATPTSPGTYPVGTGQGPAFDTMGIEVGQKKGFEKKAATKRG